MHRKIVQIIRACGLSETEFNQTLIKFLYDQMVGVLTNTVYTPVGRKGRYGTTLDD